MTLGVINILNVWLNAMKGNHTASKEVHYLAVVQSAFSSISIASRRPLKSYSEQALNSRVRLMRA